LFEKETLDAEEIYSFLGITPKHNINSTTILDKNGSDGAKSSKDEEDDNEKADELKENVENGKED